MFEFLRRRPNPDALKPGEISVEEILGREDAFSHVVGKCPDSLGIIEELKAGYSSQKDKRYYELWLRAFDLLDGLAADRSGEFEYEQDSKFIGDFIKDRMINAMQSSQKMRNVDVGTLRYMRSFHREDMSEYEIDFYDMIHGMMDPEASQ